MKLTESGWASSLQVHEIAWVGHCTLDFNSLKRDPNMRKLRLLIALLAITSMAAACGDVAPTAPQDAEFDLRGILGSGG